MKINFLKLTFSLALIGAAAAAQAQTDTTLKHPGGIASVRNLGNFPQTPEATNNDFTNRFVFCTPECYTNNQAAITADHQYRIQGTGPAKGATAMQSGSRIETRPPRSLLSTDPWVELDHPWDFVNYQADSTSP